MEFHTPVLLKEVLEYFAPAPGEVFVDCTLGGAGHALPVAKKIAVGWPNKRGALVGIDLDGESLKTAKDVFDIARSEGELPEDFPVHLVRDNYKNIAKILRELGISRPNGILADIGLSSFDLNLSGRGFSFQKDEPLDMRFNGDGLDDGAKRGRKIFNAQFILETYTEKELAEIFSRYGEENFSPQIARAILKFRQTGKIESTKQFFSIIESALPPRARFRAADSARRIFQALRIEVNGELENLKAFLPQAFAALSPGGRLGVISFHSLEDRMVKEFFREKAKGCIYPPDFPKCACGRNPEGKILTKKPLVPSAEEIESNPRSRPSKLRIIQKI